MDLLWSDGDQRHVRTFSARINFQITESFGFKEKFRVSPETVEYTLGKTGSDLKHPTHRNYALDPSQQLLVALHWMGNGSQYHGIGLMHGISKSTVQRCVKRVRENVIKKMLGEEIRWPDQNVIDIPQECMQLANFPRVAGCVDGCLIKIDAPQTNELAYVDRSGDHSLNSMFVTGPQLQFFCASCKWPDSVNDARVLRNSSLCERWDLGWRSFSNGVLLGDSIYPLKTWLIPPLANGPMTQERREFLRAHKSTRRIIECSFGVMKETFPCLNYLRLQPIAAAEVILTAAIFHNIEIKLGEEYNVVGLLNTDDLEEEHDVMTCTEEDIAEPNKQAVLNSLVALFN